jgi:hypothetical protein
MTYRSRIAAALREYDLVTECTNSIVIESLTITSKRLNCELVLLVSCTVVFIVRRLRCSRNLGQIWERCTRFITSPDLPGWPWGTTNVVFSERNGPLGVKRIIYIHLVHRLGMSGAVPLLRTYFRGLCTYAYRRNITDQCGATQRKDKICSDGFWNLRRLCFYS